ncbi:hypothetical protein KQI63_02330 [bacterium]|nr:hypothetical protein [bacterium]
MVDHINQAGGPNSVGGPKKVDQVRPEQSRPAKAEHTPHQVRTDRATISANAAEVARYQEMAELHLEAFGPSDRSAKLDEVRQRLAAGYYDRPDVVEKIAGTLVEGAAAETARASDLETAKRRTEDGFYDKPEVMDKTAENVLRRVLGRSPGE